MTKNVVVLDYDPCWPGQFDELRAFLWPKVADVAIAIEHVGSTAVPGLAAKPVIDIDIVVAEGDVVTAIAHLATIGYAHRGNLGVPGREAFTSLPGLPKHHLYLCAEGNQALANHLAVRDYLRRNATAVHEYSKLKKQLARKFRSDMDMYIQGKSECLVNILRHAGFPEGALVEIERINRKHEPHAADG